MAFSWVSPGRTEEAACNEAPYLVAEGRIRRVTRGQLGRNNESFLFFSVSVSTDPPTPPSVSCEGRSSSGNFFFFWEWGGCPARASLKPNVALLQERWQIFDNYATYVEALLTNRGQACDRPERRTLIGGVITTNSCKLQYLLCAYIPKFQHTQYQCHLFSLLCSCKMHIISLRFFCIFILEAPPTALNGNCHPVYFVKDSLCTCKNVVFYGRLLY